MVINVPGGNIFTHNNFDAIICPVNCRGVMGKGLALECKKRYPELLPNYQTACAQGLLKPGHVFMVWCTDSVTNKRVLIICLATKDDWRNPSQLRWIRDGICNLVKFIDQYNASINNYAESAGAIRTIAVPMLGCGCGGLNRNDVEKIISEGLSDNDLQFHLFT